MESLKPRVLSVEDDADNADVTRLILQLFGYDVTVAATIAKGLELHAVHTFDVFLIDRSLPDGDGLELCKWLRASGSETPIIFYSAHAYANDIKLGLDAGANAYLAKPTTAEDLLEAIKKVTGGRQLQSGNS